MVVLGGCLASSISVAHANNNDKFYSDESDSANYSSITLKS